MTKIVWQSSMRHAVLSAALLGVIAPVQAEDAVVEGALGLGAAGATGDHGDRALFGQYTGFASRNSTGLLDLEYYRRDDETGTLTKFQGADLIGETREMRLLWKRQGDWKLTLAYGELVRAEPNRVNSGMIGAGSTAPQVVHLSTGPGSGETLDLRTQRKALGLAFSKWLQPSLQFDVSVKTENKEGSELFGRGMNCPSPIAPGCAFTTGISPGWAVLLLPRPVDSNHTQFEAKLSYAFEKLRLSGGYYGSFYNSTTGALNPQVPGSLNNPVGQLQPLGAGLQPILNQPVALSPDNQAHHFHVAGSYLLTPTTQVRFKLGYAQAKQNESFAGAGLTGAPDGVSDLGGEVNTTTAIVGITSRPTRKLSLLAEVRTEDKDDETPIAAYNLEGASRYTNRCYSRTRVRGKLQAGYRFSPDYRGTFAVDYDSIDRDDFTASSAVSGISALRQRTEELSYRAELRRRMSESVSGAISWVRSRRDGSNWLRPNSGLGVTEIDDEATGFLPTAVFMPTLADRKRDKIRLSASWQPIKDLSLQFGVDQGWDRYDTPSAYGLRDAHSRLYSVDFDYRLSSRWSFNGYASFGKQEFLQARPAGYIMAFDNDSTALGLGLRAKPTNKLEIGARVAFIDDRNAYDQALDVTASANSAGLLGAAGGLPDIVFRFAEIKLFGRYELSSSATLRGDLIHQRAELNDWAYVLDGTPFVYGDNTTVVQARGQSVTFLGVRYIYRWQ